MLCVLMADIDVVVETLTGVPVEWKISSGEGNGYLSSSDRPGTPCLERRDGHDQESAYGVQSGKKPLTSVEQISTFGTSSHLVW